MFQIEERITKEGKNAIVTTGGIQSNHCRAASLFAAKNGWKCILILHGSKKKFYEESGNALLMRLSGSEFRFVKPEKIGAEMDSAMNRLSDDGYKPFYIYGGGHTREGVEAFADFTEELFGSKSLQLPDHIVLPSGTGSTQAGIITGLKRLGLNHIQVHGVSVARSSNKGKQSVMESLEFLPEISSIDYDEIKFHDNFLFGGYGKKSDELISFITSVTRSTGFILDPVYSGKAFYGMIKLMKSGEIDGKVMYWNTGGLLNLLT